MKPNSQKTFLGLRTAIYRVADIAKAKQWYSRVLDSTPYFDQPFYVGFNVAGFELGLHPEESASPLKGEGVIAYWGVADVDAALARLLKLGAGKHRDVQDVGEGIKVASVLDPFGNIFGIIENPHFSLSPQ